MKNKEKQAMKNTSSTLKDAQSEVQKAARSQDLIEVPRQAQIDRANEHNQILADIHKAIEQSVVSGV
jgi:hypothetical protein